MKLLKIILTLGLTLCLCACTKHKNDLTYGNKVINLSEEQEQNANIKTQPLDLKEIDLLITIPAQFKAQNQSVEHIYSPIDGKITDIYVEPGSTVKIGTPLARIKSDEISQIQLEFLEKIMEIDASINEMSAQYELSTQSFNRESTLFNEKISSKAEYEIALAQKKKDYANLNALKSKRSALTQVYAQRLAVYGGTINTVLKTKRIYPYVTLISSKNGVLLERKANPGEIVERNKEIFNLADLSAIWLVGYAFEKDSSILKIGQSVSGTLEESKSKKINGVLSYVSPILDSTTKTLEVRANIQNNDLAIKPNMYAEMYVNTGKANVLAVPNDAIEKYGDFSFAYVRTKPHTYEERKVETGKSNAKYTEIKSGINAGEDVVTTGSFSLLGESIKIQEQE